MTELEEQIIVDDSNYKKYSLIKKDRGLTLSEALEKKAARQELERQKRDKSLGKIVADKRTQVANLLAIEDDSPIVDKFVFLKNHKNFASVKFTSFEDFKEWIEAVSKAVVDQQEE